MFLGSGLLFYLIFQFAMYNEYDIVFLCLFSLSDVVLVQLIKVALDPVSFSIDLTALKRALTPNTIM